MGRGVVATAGDGDSSPSLAESSFRELDEVFLQTQTRIWLGEVLNTRLDEDLHISELLQDGELLFELSKVIWNLLLTKCMELRHLKHKYGPFGSRNSSGRYRPYSNVDSFLKICKILGLSGIDLFSPSDVVEKRDIRKVCTCIRALSKKARSKQLRVPDFDMVIYSVAMPTDMVGCIRRSLESSQCTPSSSSSYNSQQGSRMNLKQENFYAPSDGDDDSCSEESDEAESRYIGEIPFASASNCSDAAGVISDLEYSPEEYPIFGRRRGRQSVLESDVKGQYREEFKQSQYKSACLSDAVQSFSPENHENYRQLSYGIVSHENHDHGRLHVINKVRHSCGNGMVDASDIHFTLENDDSVVTDSSYVNAGESNYISDYLAFSDLMVHANGGSNPVPLDGENNMYDFFLNIDSEGLTSEKRSFQSASQRKFSDDEDMEVSSATSMSSVLGRVLNLDFDDQFDMDDCSSENVYELAPMGHEAEKHYEDPLLFCETKDSFRTPLCAGIFGSQEAPFKMQPRTSSSSTNYYPLSQNKCQLSGMESTEDESHGTHPSNLEDAFGLDNGLVVVADDGPGTLICKNQDNEIASNMQLVSDSNPVQCGDNHISIDYATNSSDMAAEYLKFSCYNRSIEDNLKTTIPGACSQGTALFVSDDTDIFQANQCETISESYPCLPVKDTTTASEADHLASSVCDENLSCTAENGRQDKQELDLDILAQTIPDEGKDTSPGLPPGKHGRRQLVKTVVRGAAFAGVLFLLLRFSRGNNARETDQHAQLPKHKESKFSWIKGQTGRREKGTYPARKLKLGN